MPERSKVNSERLFEADRPFERVAIASANAIDSIGRQGDSDGLPVYFAGWKDDSNHRYELHETRDERYYSRRRYNLKVINESEGREDTELYVFDTMEKNVHTCDKDWKRIKTKRKDRKAAAATVADYLRTASTITDAEDAAFNNAMESAVKPEPGLLPLARRIGRRVMRSLV